MNTASSLRGWLAATGHEDIEIKPRIHIALVVDTSEMSTEVTAKHLSVEGGLLERFSDVYAALESQLVEALSALDDGELPVGFDQCEISLDVGDGATLKLPVGAGA